MFTFALTLAIVALGMLVVVAAPRAAPSPVAEGRQSMPEGIGESTSLLRADNATWHAPRPVLCICLAYMFMSTLLVGLHLGLPNPMVVSLTEMHKVTAWQVGLFAGIGPLFTAVASLGAGVFADRFGRRPLAAASVLLALCGSGVLAVAFTYKALMIGRILHGLSIGAAMVSTCLYTAEVSPSRWRGAVGTVTEVAINAGILLVLAGAYMLSQGPGAAADADWRWAARAGVLLSAVQLALVQFLPETPRWLAARGYTEEATLCLQSLLSNPAEVQDVVRGLGEYEGAAEFSSAEDLPKVARALCMLDPQMRLPVLRAHGMAFFHMATGVIIPGVFGTLILEERYGKAMAQWGMFVMYTFKMAAILFSTAFVDYCGRLPLLVGSCVIMGIGFMMWALIWILPKAPFSWNLVGMTICMVGFSIGLGPLNYVVPAEVLPLPCRAVGVATCNVLCRITEAAVTFSILPLAQACGLPPVLALFSCVCLVAGLFFQQVMPENKQLTLEKSSAA